MAESPGAVAPDRISLPMYDLPFVRAATDRFCAAVKKEAEAVLESSGECKKLLPDTETAPYRAGEDQDAAENVWSDFRLLLSQTCGQNLHSARVSAHSQNPPPLLVPVASPVYSASGCIGNQYCGLVVVRADSGYTSLESLAGARVAVNDFGSYSGCVGLRAAVAQMLGLGPSASTIETRVNYFDADVVVTKSHRKSVQEVLRRRADCASIDCVTFALLQAETEAAEGCEGALRDPVDTSVLRIVAKTPYAPAPPFVMPAAIVGSPVANALVEGLCEATARPSEGGDAAVFEESLRLVKVMKADRNEYITAFEKLNALASPVAIDDRRENASSYHAKLDLDGYRCSLVPPLEQASGSTAEAQVWVDRGMLLVWGFNHAEALYCFSEAEALLATSQCLADGSKSEQGPMIILRAVVQWAAAHTLCTNYNKDAMTADELTTARHHNSIAASILAPTAEDSWPANADEETSWRSALCRVLVKAQSERLAPARQGDDDLGKDAFQQRANDYVRAMSQVHASVHRDCAAEVAALLADGMMQLAPWNMWRDGTIELSGRVKAVIEGAIGIGGVPDEDVLKTKLQARHPGLAHFHVHLMEMARPVSSALVERAVISALALRSQWPSCGHLIHMSSHLDVHLGHFNAAVKANIRAEAADAAFAELRGSNNYYHLYRLHSLNQLVWAASFAGRREVALAAAEALISTTPASLREQHIDIVEPLGAAIWHTRVRFGLWNEILECPVPRDDDFVSAAVSLWAKAVAAAALGRLDEADEQRLRFRKAVEVVPAARRILNVESTKMLTVAATMLDGELAYRVAANAPRSGNHDDSDHFAEAFSLLHQAVKMDEDLPYDEPHAYPTPVAHALGALLLEQGRVSEAEEVYRADLDRWPENLWSLRGLCLCLSSRVTRDSGCCTDSNHAEYDELCARFSAATTHSDIKLTHSCFCAGLITHQK